MRRNVAPPDDDVIEQANFKNSARIGERFRDADIVGGRRGISAGVIVHEQNSVCVGANCRTQKIARMKRSTVRRSRRNFFKSNYAIFRVGAKHPTFFAIERERLAFEKTKDVRGIANRRGKFGALFDAASELKRRGKRAGAAPRQTERGKIRNFPAGKLKKRTVGGIEHAAGVRLRRRIFRGRAQFKQNGEKLVIAETTRPASLKAFAGA